MLLKVPRAAGSGSAGGPALGEERGRRDAARTRRPRAPPGLPAGPRAVGPRAAAPLCSVTPPPQRRLSRRRAGCQTRACAPAPSDAGRAQLWGRVARRTKPASWLRPAALHLASCRPCPPAGTPPARPRPRGAELPNAARRGLSSLRQGGALRSPHRRHRGSHTHQTLRGGGDSGSARSVDNTPLTSSWGEPWALLGLRPPGGDNLFLKAHVEKRSRSCANTAGSPVPACTRSPRR